MDYEIKQMLEKEIKGEIRALSDYPSGSKEQAEAIDTLTKLHKLKIEEDKIALDDIKWRQEADISNNDCARREDQFAIDKRDRYFKFGLEAAGILLPLMFYAIWMKKGFKFEENGTYTSTTFRGLFNRFRPTK